MSRVVASAPRDLLQGSFGLLTDRRVLQGIGQGRDHGACHRTELTITGQRMVLNSVMPGRD